MSNFIRPKFSYNPGAGIVDFSPTNPAVKKIPVDIGPMEVVRHDSITTSGIKQSVTERVDHFAELSFEDIPLSDLASWKALYDWALEGNQITYYPDATDSLTYIDYTLEDMKFAPKWKSYKNFSLTMRLRLFVGTPTYYS